MADSRPACDGGSTTATASRWMRGERDPLGGIAELAPRSCCGRRCTGSQGFAGAGHEVSAATAISSAWPTTATSRRTSSAIRQRAGRRDRATRRRRDRTSWGWCATTQGLPEAQRIAIEDFSFPSAYIDGGEAAFAADPRRRHAYRERGRAARPRCCAISTRRAAAHDPDGAMNHSMLYLVMGQDDARGTMSVRRALDRARRPDPHLLGQGRAAADLHAHERRAAAACARAARQLHFESRPGACSTCGT